jgi:ABC-2 type transport system ATP-binding protein
VTRPGRWGCTASLAEQMPEPAIDCRNLVVRYGSLTAVDGLSMCAEPGRILALLGPNGAGKTSTVEALEGYRRPSAGEVRILGLDPLSSHRALVPHIGVMLQRGGVYPTMPARRVLELFSRLYPDPQDPGLLLERVGLGRVAGTAWKRLSGGEQQRLSLALALVGRPRVLFLDEPTAGVDPEGRLAIREVLAEQRDLGNCVLITTHELSEAEHVADDVVIIAGGRSVARGTVAELAARSGTGGISFRAPSTIEGGDLAELASQMEVETRAVTEQSPGRYLVDAQATPLRLGALAQWLGERGLPLEDLRAGDRSLEQIYLEVTRAAAGNPGTNLDTTSTAVEGAPISDTGHTGQKHAQANRPPESARPPEVPGSALSRLRAHATAEIGMTLRRGESLLLTIGIPVVLLVFFSEVHVLPLGNVHPISFLAPGMLALAIMGTALVNLSIATGFEREYGVLKRLGSTPLGRPELLGAKIASVLVIELLQAAVLVPVAFGLGWRPSASAAGPAIGVVLLATAAFAGAGLVLAGVLKAEVNLAAANGLWVLLLLVSGMLAPLSKLPGWLASVSKALPAAALSEALHDSMALGTSVPVWAWIVLACWAVGTPVVAASTFRWE